MGVGLAHWSDVDLGNVILRSTHYLTALISCSAVLGWELNLMIDKKDKLTPEELRTNLMDEYPAPKKFIFEGKWKYFDCFFSPLLHIYNDGGYECVS